MASYTATWVGPPSNPAQDDTAEAAEEAATPFEAWTDWLEEARDAIAEGDGDPDDTDTILALVLEHVVGGGPDAVALKEKRAEEILREAQASNGKITVFLHRQREARKTQKAEAAALAKRLDHMADQIGSLTREDSQLRTTLENCEQNLRQATGMLEKEIARERSLRRLLDAQRSRPHAQRVASELVKRHAAKALEVVTKSKTEAA
jgi:predicted RNase H-like nuclease (RuvC/YqgF family)